VDAAHFLALTDMSAAPIRGFDPNEWAPRRMADSIRAQFADLERDFDARRRHGLATRDEILEQTRGRRRFARYVLIRMGAYKAGKELSRLDRRTGGAISRGERQYHRVLATVRAPVTYSAGRNDLSYGSSFSFLEQNARLWARSVAVDGEILFQADTNWVPWTWRERLDLFAHDERWTCRLSRRIPLLGMEGVASYGTTSTRLSLSAVKRLDEHLSSEYRLSAPRNGTAPPEHSVLVRYARRL
jgi:hypothetical protein